MTRPSRRDFLKMGARVLGSAALGRFLSACGTRVEPTATATPSREPTILPSVPATAAVQASSTEAAATPPSMTLPDVAVARNGEPEALVRSAIAALGGMGAFVAKGANVIIKPNICVAYHGYEYAATTNPWVVAALVRLCLEAGAGSVKVMDRPFGGTQQAAYQKSGIKEQVEAAGGEMDSMPAFKYSVLPIPGAARMKNAGIFEDILKADLVINVPIAKTHGLSGLTLGLKNLMGVVNDRAQMHSHLAENLADLASLVKPALTVVDAVRILTANGPSGGNLNDVRKLDTVIASRDIVAADSYAATLFGMRPDDLSVITTAASRGLGRSDIQNLRIEEIQVGG